MRALGKSTASFTNLFSGVGWNRRSFATIPPATTREAQRRRLLLFGSLHGLKLVECVAKLLRFHIWTPPVLQANCFVNKPKYDCVRISGFSMGCFYDPEP